VGAWGTSWASCRGLRGWESCNPPSPMVCAFSWVSLVALAGFHPGVLGWSLVFNGFCKLMMSPALANIDRQRLSFCPLDNECTGKAELSLCDPQCGTSVVVPCLACLRTLRPRTAFDWKQCLELLVPSLSNDSFAAKASEDGYAVKWLCRTFLVSPPLCKSALRAMRAQCVGLGGLPKWS